MGVEKLIRGVAIVGAGMTQFGTHKDKTIRDLFVDAFLEMTASVDEGFEIKDFRIFSVKAHTLWSIRPS